ncbi:hypothetical protein BKA70DRAFT_1255789 [Coprinopsis sp. MPI-PUGE-AT-0042]|nr:hypothetical protein BKA70DRAFT_1255789 [Coprinopsis sp. MPI-PUGE-AT-0042]
MEHNIGPNRRSMEYPSTHLPAASPPPFPASWYHGPNEHGSGPSRRPTRYPSTQSASGYYGANEHGAGRHQHVTFTHPPMDGYIALSPFHHDSNRRNDGIPPGTTYDDIDAGPPVQGPAQHSSPAPMPPSPPILNQHGPGPQPHPVNSRPGLRPKRNLCSIALDLTSGIPKEIYTFLLLRLPALYFSRVARIFEEADMTLGEIKKMVLDSAASNVQTRAFDAVWYLPKPQQMPPAYDGLTNTWEAFIDSVMREWKTFNIISVLLLSAILTILQIDAAANDAIIRYTALSSLICALISLLYGCMYIIRFGTMRKPYKAAEWALEAQKSKTAIFWNVWVMLAMPAVWLSWSLILYICCIMAFVWRTSTHGIDRGPLSDRGLLAVRAAITVLLGLGMLYGALVLLTFRRYGDVMDKTWKQRVKTWITPLGYESQPYYGQPAPHQYYAPRPPTEHWRTRTWGKDDVSMKGSPFVPPLTDSEEDLHETIPPLKPSHSSNRRENQPWYIPPRRPSKAMEEHTSPSSPEAVVKASDTTPTVPDNELDVQPRQARTERARRHKPSDSSHAIREGVSRDTKNTTELLKPSPVSPPPPLPPPKVAAPPIQPSKSTHHHSATAPRTRGKERVKEAPPGSPNKIYGMGAEKRAPAVSATRVREGMARASSPPLTAPKP